VDNWCVKAFWQPLGVKNGEDSHQYFLSKITAAYKNII